MIKNNSIQTETTRMKCLAYAPGMVFLLVASADNKIDQKELKRFATLMAHKDYAILASMLEQSGACVAHLLREILTDNLDPYKELQSACALLDVYLSTQAAQTYKLTLLRLARGIAKPSGRLTGFFNNKMTQEQRTSIAVVANLLGLHDKTGQQNVNREAVDVQKNGHANYSLTKDLPDTLFPALKTSDWATSTNADSLTRELYRNDGQSQANPVIAYAIDKPEIVDFISSDSVHESLSVEQIHDKAMQNLENRLLRQAEWKTLDFDSGEKNIGHISGLVLSGDYYCSEAILSQTLLNQAHKQLDADLLMAIAPIRGELYITKLVSENQPESDRLMFAQFAVSRYFDKKHVHISPNVWIIRSGAIAGYVDGMDKIIESAKQSSSPPVENDGRLIHTAKTYAEEKGIGIEIDVIARDLGKMMLNLQQLIRTYVAQGIQQKSFSGNLRVHLNIQDPGYHPEMNERISEQLVTMSHFLCRQFSCKGIKTANNMDIKLFCSVIN